MKLKQSALVQKNYMASKMNPLLLLVLALELLVFKFKVMILIICGKLRM